jgi:hypothetical protein
MYIITLRVGVIKNYEYTSTDDMVNCCIDSISYFLNDLNIIEK